MRPRAQLLSKPIATRALGVAVILMLALALISPSGSAWGQTVKKPPPYGAQKWREKKGAITDADRERLAKFTAYLGGRPKGAGDGRSSSAKSLTIKGDAVFRKHLKDNRLKLLDSIDNDTGLQVTLVQDLDTKRVFVLPRGTEFGVETINDGVIADFGEFYTGQLKIGKAQYESGQNQIRQWMLKYKGNIEVIGHSLGGAIVQRIVLDNAKYIVSATVFNSAGLEVETVRKAISSAGKLKEMSNPDGSPKLRVFNVESDIVGKGGGLMIPADVVLAKGGALDKNLSAAHTQLIFGPDVKRAPIGYLDYSFGRDRGATKAEGLLKGFARAVLNITRGKNPIKNELRDLLLDLGDYRYEILRDIEDVKREEWRARKKKRDIGKIVTGVIDRNLLDVEQGRKPKTVKKAAAVVVPGKKTGVVPVSTSPKVNNLRSSGSGKLVGNFVYKGNLIWEIIDGNFSLIIEGSKVTGTLKGTIKEKDVYSLTESYLIYAFEGQIKGTFKKNSQKISASVAGNWSGQGGRGKFDEGFFRGKFDSKEFAGDWMIEGIGDRFQDTYYGNWKLAAQDADVTEDVALAPKSTLTDWDTYMCETYRDDWDQMAKMGISCR